MIASVDSGGWTIFQVDLGEKRPIGYKTRVKSPLQA